jgi:hypothetical protein
MVGLIWTSDQPVTSASTIIVITNLGHGGMFQSQHLRRVVVPAVVVQVVVFVLDDNLKLVLGACIVLHSMNVLKPAVSACTEFFF